MGEEAKNRGGEESLSPTGTERVKFYCSHGGKILPRPSDGTLKYIAGETRVVVVPRSISFPELRNKINDMFNGEYVLKYQIGLEDLDSLITVKSNEDIRHMIEEYDRLEREGISKLRTFLFPVKLDVIECRHSTLSSLGPQEMEQRFVHVVNGIIHPTNLGLKPLLNTSRLKSFSPSPSEGSPQSLSPRSSTVTHNSSLLQENSLINNLQSRLARVHKVQSSPTICTLGSDPDYNVLYTKNYFHQPTHCHRSSTSQYQHYYNSCQSPPSVVQNHHIYTHHGCRSSNVQHNHHSSNHHNFQSPNNMQDHHVCPPLGPVTDRAEYNKHFQVGLAGHQNPSHHYAMSRGYPGSGGHRRWDHLEQYATPSYTCTNLVTSDSVICDRRI